MTTRQLQSLPAEISRSLQQLDWKVRCLATLRGVAVLVTLLVTGIGLGLLLDLWLGLGETVRIVWLSLLSAAALAVIVWGIILPWFWRTTPADLAALVEQAHPELRERLTSTVELLRPDLPESDKGSALMRELLVAETKSVVRKSDLDDAVEGERAQRAGWFAVAAMFAMIVPLFISRDGYTLLLSRFFTPWQNLAQASNLYFVVDPGDRTAPRGSDVVIDAEPKWRLSEDELPQEVWLSWRSPNGEADERRMLWHPDRRRFTATLPHVFHPFDFHVTSGPARTREYHVNVVEPPAISAFVVDVQPPAYTGLPAQRLDGAVGETTVFERSKVRFELQFNKPLASTDVLWFASPTTGAPAPRLTASAAAAKAASVDEAVRESVPLTLAADGRSAVCEFEALPESGGRFALRLMDEHGLSNPQEPIRALRIQLDQPPTVAFADQVDQPEARPGDVVSLPVTAGDDIAVHDLELHFSVVPQGGRNLVPVEGRLLGVKGVEHVFTLNLAELATDLGVPLHLKNNDRLRLKLRAADERPIPGPNETWSEERTIQIRDDAAPYGFEMLAQTRAQWRKMLEEIRAQLEQNRTQVADLKTESDADQRQQLPFDQNEAIPPLAAHQREQATRLEQLAALFASSPLFGNLTETAQQVAREELAQAPQSLDAAAVEAELPKKSEQLQASLGQVESAIDKLKSLEEGFDKIADLERDLAEIQRLAERAQQLADEAVALDQDRSHPPADLPPERQASRDAALEQERQALVEEHQDLSQDLASLLDRRPEILDAAREQQFDRLRELARQALELARPQDQLATELQADAQQQATDLESVSERQQELLRAAQELQGATEPNQSRQLVTPLDLEALRQAVAELDAGNPAAAAAAQQQAAAELERLAAELRQNELLPEDPHAAAQQLVRRETELQAQIEQARQRFDQAQQAAQAQPADAAAQQQLAESKQELRNLAAAQTAIQSAAAHLPVPHNDQDKVRDAVKRAFDTVNELLDAQPAKAVAEAEQTRRALQALADDIGPPDQREREAATEARRLREQQEGLARETAEVAKRAQEGQPEDQTRTQLSQLANREQQLARELAQLAAPQTARPLQQAAQRDVADASTRLEQQRPAESAAAAREAAQALADLEQSLANKSPAGEQLAQLTAQEQRVGEQLADDGQPPSADELRAAGREQRDAARAVNDLRTPLLEPQRDATRQQLDEAARAADEAAGDASRLADARRETAEAQQALEQLQSAVNGPGEPPSPGQQQQVQNELARALAPQSAALQQVAERAEQLAQRQADLQTRTDALAQEQASAQAEAAAAAQQPADPSLSREQQQRAQREREQQARDRQRRIEQQAGELRQQQEQLTRDINNLPPEAASLAAAEAAVNSEDARDALNERQPAAATAPQSRAQAALEELAAAARGRQQAQQQSAQQQAQATLQPADAAAQTPAAPSDQLAQRAEALAEQQRQLAEAAQQSRQQRLAQQSPAAPTPAANDAPQTPVAATPTAPNSAAPTDQAAAAMTPAEQAAAALAAQEQLAQQAAELALATAQQAGADSAATNAALQFAQQAAESARAAAAGQLPQAAQGGQQAAQSAQQTAAQLQAAGPETPEAELAVQAANLAAQQQAVAQQVDAMAASPAARAAAQSQAQQRMATQAAGLASEFSQIAGELGAQPLDRPQQGEQAGAARQSSQQASQAIEQSAGNLSAGNPQNASAQASQGAQQLRDAAAQALAAAGDLPASPSAVPQDVGSQLTQAMRQLQAAGEQLAQAPGQTPTGQAPANSGQPPAGQQPGQPQPGQNPQMANAENAAGQPMPGQEGQPGEPQSGATQTAQTDAMSGEGQPASSPQPGQPGNPSTQNLQNVAQALNQAAEQLGLTPGQMQGQRSQAQQAQPGGTPTPDGESSDTGAQETVRLTDLDVQLKNITARNWGELPGKLQTEILQSSQSRTGGDYGRVIQRYFEEVTRSRTTPAAAP